MCLEHIHLELEKISDGKFDALSVVENVITGKDTGYQAPYKVENVIVIPIMSHKDCVGILCLVDSLSTEGLLDLLSPLLSIAQLILLKQKLM